MNEDLSGLDLIELLDRLEPLPEPPPLSLWPQTEAWLWIGLVAIVLAGWQIRRAVLHRRANAYRRAALCEIDAAGDCPAALAEILRRTALAAFPRGEVAGLYGDDWLAFLDRTGSLDRTGGLGRTSSLDRGRGPDRTARADGGCEFRDGVGRAFAQAPYTRAPAESAALAVLARRWVRGHRVGSEAGS